jgi:hypothetical protein
MGQSANCEGTNLSDSLEVAIDVNHAKAMMQRSFGDEQVRDRRPMPHAVMVRKVSLKPKGAFQDVSRSSDDVEARTKIDLECVIVLRRSSRIQLFKFAHGTNEQRTGHLLQLGSNLGIVYAGGGAFVEDPARYRHISSELSTLRSARFLSC